MAPALIEQNERKEQRTRDEEKARKAAELQAKIAAKSSKVKKIILSNIFFVQYLKFFILVS